mmetsp:Transcript_494/g.1909  ORF Transcript_494/g.1909 Transcript_494/m.1909 type:complete len:225 (+) Transcript_494:300-974(+)
MFLFSRALLMYLVRAAERKRSAGRFVSFGSRYVSCLCICPPGVSRGGADGDAGRRDIFKRAPHVVGDADPDDVPPANQVEAHPPSRVLLLDLAPALGRAAGRRRVRSRGGRRQEPLGQDGFVLAPRRHGHAGFAEAAVHLLAHEIHQAHERLVRAHERARQRVHQPRVRGCRARNHEVRLDVGLHHQHRRRRRVDGVDGARRPARRRRESLARVVCLTQRRRAA